MPGERNEQTAGASRASLQIALFAGALALAGCGTSGSNVLGSMNIFGQKKTDAMKASDASGAAIASNDDVECPGIDVRTGAATLMIGGKAGEEPSALDLRYQGTLIRTARECHVSAGVMTMKVGIEGRVITGPAGGPGTVDVPLRIAVVQEGMEPKAVASKFVVVPVTIVNAVDRVTFTHVESDVTFPMPVPLANIDAYVVYVGFDPLALQEKKKPVARRKPATKPKRN